MSEEETIFERLKTRGEEMLQQVSGDLMNNPRFVAAMRSALRGKEKLDEASARALKAMNVPTRTEFKKALRRIEALEAELSAVKASARPTPKKRTGKKAR